MVLALPIQHLLPLLDSELMLCLGNHSSLSSVWVLCGRGLTLSPGCRRGMTGTFGPAPHPLWPRGLVQRWVWDQSGSQRDSFRTCCFWWENHAFCRGHQRVRLRPGLAGSLRAEPAQTEQSPVTQSPLFELLDPTEPEAVPALGYFSIRASKCPFFA